MTGRTHALDWLADQFLARRVVICYHICRALPGTLRHLIHRIISRDLSTDEALGKRTE